MSSKTTSFILLKSQKCGHVMPAGAFGAVRPVGAILPTATAAGPIPLTKPRTATPLRMPLPDSHVWTMNILVTGHANMTLT